MGMKSHSQGQYVKVQSSKTGHINQDTQFFTPVSRRSEIASNIKQPKMNFVTINSHRNKKESNITQKLSSSNTNIKSLSAKDPEVNRKNLDFRAPFFSKMVQETGERKSEQSGQKDAIMLTQKPSIDRKKRNLDSSKDLRKSINRNSLEKNNNDTSSRKLNRINLNKPASINTQ